MAPKWTLITGASEGLGAEFARIAAAEGHDLILVARQEDKLEALAADLRTRHGVAVEVRPADLGDPAATEALWRALVPGRHIEIVVNNAGLGRNGRFAVGDISREMSSVMVNVAALTILTKAATQHMLAEGGGRILNVGSIAGFMPGPYMAVYHATKAYVLTLGEALAVELSGTPVSITTLCPGATATSFARGAQMEHAMLFKALPLPSAESVARAGWRAMKKGRAVKVTGALNWLFAVSPRFVPRALVPRIAAIFLK